jgi:inner membrane protein
MISLYSINALRSRRRALIILAELSALYGILFVILQMQDFSLLLGTAGLFSALSIVMYTTRNMDWYAKDNQGVE